MIYIGITVTVSEFPISKSEKVEQNIGGFLTTCGQMELDGNRDDLQPEWLKCWQHGGD